MDLSTKYMGLDLKNPIIIGSSGQSNSIDKIKKLADNNAGAIVLKSLFEEQIMSETSNNLQQNLAYYPEAFDYISAYTKDQNLSEYLKVIEDAKKSVDIPIIASVNCVSPKEWINFTKNMEDAGADAIELNVSMLPSDVRKDGNANEKTYFEIIEKVKSKISIPLALKMSYFSAGLSNLIQKISWTKYVDSIVLFNRYFNPDIDINNFKITSSNVFSTPEDITLSLRWIALLSDKVDCNLAASTGVHSGEGIIKQLLAGATAVQIVSIIYKNGPEYISTMLNDLIAWMSKHNFSSIDDFRGKLGGKENTASFERIQYMKYFGGIE